VDVRKKKILRRGIGIIGSNENKISDGYRERASIEVEVF
jgi:hypothetical protein